VRDCFAELRDSCFPAVDTPLSEKRAANRGKQGQGPRPMNEQGVWMRICSCAGIIPAKPASLRGDGTCERAGIPRLASLGRRRCQLPAGSHAHIPRVPWQGRPSSRRGWWNAMEETPSYNTWTHTNLERYDVTIVVNVELHQCITSSRRTSSHAVSSAAQPDASRSPTRLTSRGQPVPSFGSV
jgi:hypothetical protein